MATSFGRYPLTPDQRTQLTGDLTLIEEKLQGIVILMRACYGEDSQPAVRADETIGALQRFQWELERVQRGVQTAAP